MLPTHLDAQRVLDGGLDVGIAAEVQLGADFAVHDRALLLFAWAPGGRRRSEVSDAVFENLQRADKDTWQHPRRTTTERFAQRT